MFGAGQMIRGPLSEEADQHLSTWMRRVRGPWAGMHCELCSRFRDASRMTRDERKNIGLIGRHTLGAAARVWCAAGGCTGQASG